MTCVLGNDVGGAARSTPPVTLHLRVNITPPTLYNSPPSIPTADGSSPPEEAPIPGRIRPPSPLPLSHRKPVEASNKPQSREEAPSTSTKDPRPALDMADHAMKQMDRLDSTLKGAIGRVKWVMDTLSPVAEVRIIPFDVLSRANFYIQHFALAKMAHGLLLAIPKARPFVSLSERRDAHAISVWMADNPRTGST